MSYVVEAALGIEDKGAVATRGWFRIDPGQCRAVLQGNLEAETLYIHARALAIYGASPLPQSGHADLCVAKDNFVLAARRTCAPRRQIARPFHDGAALADRAGARSPTSPRTPNTPTSRRATPASSGCW